MHSRKRYTSPITLKLSLAPITKPYWSQMDWIGTHMLGKKKMFMCFNRPKMDEFGGFEQLHLGAGNPRHHLKNKTNNKIERPGGDLHHWQVLEN